MIHTIIKCRCQKPYFLNNSMKPNLFEQYIKHENEARKGRIGVITLRHHLLAIVSGQLYIFVHFYLDQS